MENDETDRTTPSGSTSASATEPRAGGGGDEALPGSARARMPGPWRRLKAAWANPAYRFVLLFLPYLGIVSIGYPAFVRRHNPIIQAFIKATAAIEYWILLPFSSKMSLNGKVVVFNDFGVTIIDECTGIYEMLIFSAAVLAFPTSWKKKFLGLLLGNPLIYLFNIVRIAMLIVVGHYYSAAFEFMHLYFWQATMIVMITSVWLLWIVKVVRSEEDSSPTPG